MSDSADRYTLLRRRLDAFTRKLERVHEGDIEAVHSTRVASRRLRELVPLLELDGSTTRKLLRRFRNVTRELGAVRQLDVLMLMIDGLDRDCRCSPTALKEVGAAIAAARNAARERLASKLPLAKLDGLADRFERIAKRHRHDQNARGTRGSTRAWMWALEARVARRAVRVRSAVEATGSVYIPQRLHDVRIALKKFRYAVELLAEARDQPATAEIAALKHAQDVLGRLHDLEVLADRGRRVQVSLSPPDPTTWREIASLVHAAEDDCRPLHARYMHDRVRLLAIADRMGAAKPLATPVARITPVTRRAAG